jgi:ABC-type Fe3+/spermidine/putrescine transport system ATPase subunit
LGSGNVLHGEVIQTSEGNPCVDIIGMQLPVDRNYDVGDNVKFSIKPEDIRISLDIDNVSATGIVASILPQVGSFKITIEYQDTSIIVLTYDEDLVSKLRQNGTRQVSFSFDPELAVILSH